MSAPYLDQAGAMIIPCDAPERYRWWQGGQAPDQTARELGMPESEIASRYLPPAAKCGIRRLSQEPTA